MNSKEALEELQCVLASNQATKRYSDIFEENLLRPIKKDLEVLEILKKWVLVNETYDDLFPYGIKLRKGYVSNRSCLVFTKDDYEKVKEWLENDKQRSVE